MSAYHDLNNDKELNANLIGIPKEPYGFSIKKSWWKLNSVGHVNQNKMALLDVAR